MAYPDGSTYEGSVVLLRRHGRGTLMDAATHAVYVGEFYEDRKEGRGRLMKADGEVYEGGFKNDLFDGHGELRDEPAEVKSEGAIRMWRELMAEQCRKVFGNTKHIDQIMSRL